MSAALRQRTLASGSSPSFYDGRQLGEVEQALLWTLLQEDPQCTSQALLDKAAERQLWVRVSLRHLNRWRAMWQLSRRKGRPPRPSSLVPVRAESAVVAVTLRVSFVGVHLFARWLDQQGAFEPVVAGLKQAITVPQHAHPDDDSALWPHRESTLRRRFPALFFAPLLGIERLTACDTHEHPRATLMGSSYQSSTLSQLLGELERVEAAGALMPILSRDQAGQLTDGDGHRSASWSRKPMHKGKSTMHGRIMVGSQAVMSHDGEGQGVFVAYYPPDMHLSQLILAYGHQVAAATGSRLFVMDRAVHSQALARAFDEAGFGLLGMLDDNEHQGLESFEATEVDPLDDGTRVYQGPWKAARMAERRALVIVEPPPGKTLVYWGTPKVQADLEARQWPQGYRARTELQENAFKAMMDHGGLAINYGRKTIIGSDRHQQRAQDKAEASRETAGRRVEKKTLALEAKRQQVAVSEGKGHGKRLAQRQRALAGLAKELSEAQHHEAHVQAHVAAVGPPKERSDRDFRKQTIMTIRTLFLENLLQVFMAVLLAKLPTTVRCGQVLRLLFARSGARIEKGNEVMYWVNTTGLSRSNRRLLAQIVEGLRAMGLEERGQAMRVGLKDVPP